jgi:serine/alanine adding enzyme
MIRHYLLTTEDAERWRTALPTETCVMGSLEYVRILERESGYPARLLVVESAGARVAYPFLLRPIARLACASHLAVNGFDTITPEYTGPLRFGTGPLEEGEQVGFADLFASYGAKLGVVAEFAHLSPWESRWELLDPGHVQVDRELVYVDLTMGEEWIWDHSFSSDTRRMTRQARKANVRVRHATSQADVLEFHRLYTSTMDRRAALDRYYYSPEYFLGFFETMSENAFFLLAECEGRPVAGGLYLHDRSCVYWHLSAVDMEFSRARPVNAYHYEAIRWGVREGKARMLCGGGYEPGDGVFRFKAGFSPLRVQFRTYKRVHDQELYDALVTAWSAHHGGVRPASRFFPAYRSEDISAPSALYPSPPARAAAE